MVHDILVGEQVYLKCADESCCTQEYVNWLNDPVVNQFLETRWEVQTLETVAKYVRQMRGSHNDILFNIITLDSNRHIGNIKIGPIDYHHKKSFFAYFIGNKNYWGKGIATEIISLTVKYAFENLSIHKLWGGYYATNVGSGKALKKNGFHIEGCLEKEVITTDGIYDDHILVGLLAEEYFGR